MDIMFGMLKNMGVIIEDLMDNVIDGISDIMSELDIIICYLWRDAEVQINDDIVEMSLTYVVIATCTFLE